MKKLGWQLKLGIVLVVFSALVYFIHYLIFRDPHHIFIYMVGDIAFVFFEVLMVSLIIHRLLGEREKRNRMEKLNMVIGAFFSEVGTELLARFSDSDPRLDEIRKELCVSKDWDIREYNRLSRRLENYDYSIEIDKVGLDELKVFLIGKRDFLLRLLENPNLLEHERFTELLRAVFHLAEELGARPGLLDLPISDLTHLTGDIKRAYVQLARQWLDYMRYLKKNYPFLFSLATRTNPFDQTGSPIVKE